MLALGAASMVSGARAEDNPVIDYRQRVMRTLEEQAAALGQILSTVIPDDNMAAHLEAISLTASVALSAFKPNVEGGESLPDVWKNWDDFSKRMNDFAQQTAKVAKAAKDGTGSKEELMTGMTDALSCKGCHDVYRLTN